MAIRDAQNMFSDAQAITADAGSTNIIDLVAGGLLGNGEPMGVEIIVDVAADGTTTDETYEFEVQTDGDIAFGSATDLVVRTVGHATLVAGYRFVMVIPPEAVLERYLRLRYDVGGTTPTIT